MKRHASSERRERVIAALALASAGVMITLVGLVLGNGFLQVVGLLTVVVVIVAAGIIATRGDEDAAAAPPSSEEVES